MAARRKSKSKSKSTRKYTSTTPSTTRRPNVVPGPDVVTQRDAEVPAAPSEVVPFEVLCRPRSEARMAELQADLSLETVDRHVPDARTLQDVSRFLQQRGFRVFGEQGGTSVSAEGPKRLFEQVFHTGLRKRRRTLTSGGRAHTFEFFDRKVDAPEPSLEDAPGVLDVSIQRPPIHLASVLPPPVPYFHLHMPGDVALLTRAALTHRRTSTGGDRATGLGVKVAMIDTGFAVHPYFQAHGYRMTAVGAPDAVGLPTDDPSGHGTGESANVMACAPDATFIGIKQGLNAVLAFDRAAALGAQVISCSWGWHLPGETVLPPALVPLQLRILAAIAAGTTVVFAGGNGQVSFPGMMPEVISAGGVYVDGQGNVRASDYASSFMSLIYPGRRVPDFCGLVGLRPKAAYLMLPIPESCAIDTGSAGAGFPDQDETLSNDGWAAFSGTSAAAPQIAGICALLLQKRPTLTPAQLKAILTSTATDVTLGSSAMGEAAGPGPDPATGTGLVNAFDAWMSA